MLVKKLLANIGLYAQFRYIYRRLRWPGIVKTERTQLQKMTSFYAQFISQGDLCFDIGANIGSRVEAFLKCGASVVAVEPQPICIQFLTLYYKHNHQVTIIPQALGNKPGEAELFVGNESTLATMSPEWLEQVQASGRFGNHTWNKRVTVPVTTLDTLNAKYGCPVFCKIDVEGFELEVLQGLSTPIRYLSFEFTPETFERTRDCIAHLEKLGTPRFNFSEGESMIFALVDWLNSDEFLDFLKEQPKEIFGDVYARFV